MAGPCVLQGGRVTVATKKLLSKGARQPGGARWLTPWGTLRNEKQRPLCLLGPRRSICTFLFFRCRCKNCPGYSPSPQPCPSLLPRRRSPQPPEASARAAPASPSLPVHFTDSGITRLRERLQGGAGGSELVPPWGTPTAAHGAAEGCQVAAYVLAGSTTS